MDLIFGYLGFGNYGDEELAKLAVNQAGYDKNSAKLSIKNNFYEHLQLIFSCKRMIAIGGMFQDLSSKTSVVYYALVLIFAKLLGKKIILLAQGIGPLNNFLSKLLSFFVFKLADEISVRDKLSSELLTDLKIDHELVQDLFFSMAYDLELEREQSAVFVSLRQSKKLSGKFFNELAAKLNQKNKTVIFLIMDKKDIPVNQELELLLDNEINIEYCYASEYSIKELVTYLAKLGLEIFSMRYHALVLASMAGIELNAIDNDPKNLELLSSH